MYFVRRLQAETPTHIKHMATYCGDIWLHIVETYGYILWRHMATYCGDIWLHIVETYGYILWRHMATCCEDIWLHVVETYGYMLWRHMATCCGDIWLLWRHMATCCGDIWLHVVKTSYSCLIWEYIGLIRGRARMNAIWTSCFRHSRSHPISSSTVKCTLLVYGRDTH